MVIDPFEIRNIFESGYRKQILFEIKKKKNLLYFILFDETPK